MQALTALLTPELAAQWSKGTAIDWANESSAAARRVYCFPGTNRLLRAGTARGEQYVRFALPIVQRRLAQAGVRLAAVLNKIFE